MIPRKRQSGGATQSSGTRIGQAVGHGVLLAICSLISYASITYLLVVARIVPRDDEFLGGMWAVIATIFSISLQLPGERYRSLIKDIRNSTELWTLSDVPPRLSVSHLGHGRSDRYRRRRPEFNRSVWRHHYIRHYNSGCDGRRKY